MPSIQNSITSETRPIIEAETQGLLSIAAILKDDKHRALTMFSEKQIVAYVEAAHTARRRAKALLEAAKRAVEVAIEENEAAGLAVLDGGL